MGCYRKETHQYVTIILLLPEYSSADSSVATCVLAVPGLCRLLWCTCFSLPWHTAGRRHLSRYIQFLPHRWFQHSPFPVPAFLSVVSAAFDAPIGTAMPCGIDGDSHTCLRLSAVLFTHRTGRLPCLV